MTDAPNDGEQDTRQHELVIIRRRNDGDEAPHKGGVWKIAHADFMTALMAFFLVMWLITATDEKTITGIANYFNPMRLSDATTKPKGVFTMEPGGEAEGKSAGGAKASKRKDDKAGQAPEFTEAALFDDPYEALNKIAAQADEQRPPRGDKTRGPAQRGGDAFRDPFDPDFQRGPPQQGEVDSQPVRAGQEAAAKGDAGKGKDEAGKDAGKGADAGARDGADRSVPKEPAPRDAARDAVRAKLTQQIEEAIAQSGFSTTPAIEVRNTSEGILISITDQYDFEMFGIASAQPKPELVVLMEKIGKIVAARPERIVIRGHTDGRPFRSKDYDNWRLSTARAQMANYMLVRSGIPEERIDHIEGYADHELKDRDDPLAASNRRIEILLEKGKP